MKRVPERSLARAAAQFFDPDWVAIVPSTARYRLDCETTCTEVLGWTTLVPASSMTIEITAQQNAIINQSNRREIKVLTVEVNTGTTSEMNQQSRYQVDNLRGVR